MLLRSAIARILLDLRREHGPGYVRRLQHLTPDHKEITRPPLHETIMPTPYGELLLLYNTPTGSTKAVRIKNDGMGVKID